MSIRALSVLAIVTGWDIGGIPSLPNKRGLLIWDNCRPHKVPAVRATFEEWGFETQELPPRMTDLVQIVDLVVDGPLKMAIRGARCCLLFA